MVLTFILKLLGDYTFFTGAYSNSVFPEPLGKEDEEKYLTKCKEGNKDARSKLIEHNLRLVAHIVKKFDTKESDIDDLIGIGTIGLIKGIDTYEINKKVKLTTYIAKCIENAMFTSRNIAFSLLLFISLILSLPFPR